MILGIQNSYLKSFINASFNLEKKIIVKHTRKTVITLSNCFSLILRRIIYVYYNKKCGNRLHRIIY